MEKMLVATDLSTNSTAGIYFAIQISTQKKLRLVFLHVNKVMEDEILPNPEHIPLFRQERENLHKEMDTFISSIYKSMRVNPVNYECVISYRFGVVNTIMEYAEINYCSYICICTHGAGNVSKLLGTTAGELVNLSKVPILCIPQSYQVKSVTRLLYASDLVKYEQELKIVVTLAKSVKAEVDMLHFSSKETALLNEGVLNNEMHKKYKYKIAIHLKRRSTNNTLLEDIDQAVAELTPSLIIMFTEQDRSLFELLFLSSTSEQYSFRTKIPLLVINKPSNQAL